MLLPPGSQRGLLIDRNLLREAGRRAVPAYRMALGLSFLWHDPGHLRIPSGKGRTQRWWQVTTATAYPMLTNAELAG